MTIGLHRQLTIKILRTLTCAKNYVWANGVVTHAPTRRQLVLPGIFVWRMKMHQEHALLENLGTKSGSRLKILPVPVPAHKVNMEDSAGKQVKNTRVPVILVHGELNNV